MLRVDFDNCEYYIASIGISNLKLLILRMYLYLILSKGDEDILPPNLISFDVYIVYVKMEQC